MNEKQVRIVELYFQYDGSIIAVQRNYSRILLKEKLINYMI